MSTPFAVLSRPIRIAALAIVLFLLPACAGTLASADSSTVRARAEAGDREAQYEMGCRAQHGSGGVPRDLAEAVRWYRRAADAALPAAQYNLGVMLVGGLGAEKDETEAARMFLRAAERGLAPAQYALSVLFDQGVGVERDPAQAFEWCRKAATQGHADAQYNMGVSYEKGLGVEKDLAEAMEWFRLAAAQGEASAIQALERMGK